MKTKICIRLLTFIPLIFLLAVTAIADVPVPASRMIDWSNAGANIQNYTTQFCNIVADYGAQNNGSYATNNSAIFNAAINDCPPGQYILIPAGTYIIGDPITINKGIVLRGAGPENTILVSTRTGACIQILGSGSGTFYNITNSPTKGATTIVVDGGTYANGDYVHIRRNNPGVPSYHSLGQFNRVQSGGGTNTLTLENPLYGDYNTGSPELRAVSMVSNAGVEDLTINHDCSANGYGSATKVWMEYAANSWVKNVSGHGYSCNATVTQYSYKCEIRDCFFYHTYDEAYGVLHFYSYGIEVRKQSSDCLVENNVVDCYRHSFVTQEGPSGNVYAYNFAWNVFTKTDDNDENSPNTRYPTLALEFHGGDLPIYSTLIEGNCVEWISGGTGDKFGNTFLRNRATQSGMWYLANANVIGNELPQTKYDETSFVSGEDFDNDIRGTDGNTILYSNYDTHNGGLDTIYYSSKPVPNSYYLSEKPQWFGDLPWPPYGGEIMEAGGGVNSGRIPAEVRFFSWLFPENTPTGLAIQNVDTNEVELSWNHSSSNSPIEFIICRSEDGTNFERVGSTDTTSYVDTSVLAGTQYYYYVRARNFLYDLEIREDGATTPYLGPIGIVGGESDDSNWVNCTTVEDTTPPTAPSEVLDGNDPDNDSDYSYSLTSLSAYLGSASDPESSISRYEYAIGTTPGGYDVVTMWTDGGIGPYITHTGLSLSYGTTYYFKVRAINGAGLNSGNTISDGICVIPDPTPPSTPAEVRDGLNMDVDSSTSTTKLSANWDACTDNETGILRYEYAIGTTAGGTDILTWTGNGTNTSVTVLGLTLYSGIDYYFSVRAVNNSNMAGNITSSDGLSIPAGSAPPQAPVDTTAPVISQVRATSISDTKATIIWITDEEASSRVEYGVDTNYGSTSSLDTNLVTNHSIVISGLTKNIEYHFRVISADSSGNGSVSGNYTFRTSVDSAEVKTYPNPYEYSENEPMTFEFTQIDNGGTLKIYTIAGKIIKTIELPVGEMRILWDGKDETGTVVASGLYLYVLTTAEGKLKKGKFAFVK